MSNILFFIEFFIAAFLLIFIASLVYRIWERKIYIWLGGYFKWLLDYKSRKIPRDKLVHVMFIVVDHFEPGTDGVDKKTSDERFDTWYIKYPALAKKHKDSYGKHPQHVFFFPPHYYTYEYMMKLSELSYEGFGEVEFHLHHDNDNSDSLKKTIIETLELYSPSGALITAEKEPRKTYGFIHGDWALDNSRGGKYCGVNDELIVLKNTGCYADFTMPSLLEAQAKKINSIYYAKDDPDKPKSYDKGIDVEVGKDPSGDLMLVEGPLSINWKSWKHKFYPAIEDSALTSENPPLKNRIDHWVKCAVHVRKKPEWIFIKVHVHGAPEKDHDTLLGEVSNQMFSYLETKYNDGKKYKLHYVSSREAYNIIKAAEAGKTGDPDEFRGFLIPPYANQVIKTNALYSLKTWTEDGFQLDIKECSGKSCFEFKGKVIKKLMSCSKSIAFTQDNSIKEARLKLKGKENGEAIFITPSEITRIDNAIIQNVDEKNGLVITEVKFEFKSWDHEITIEWKENEQ